jgi:hypothetical protein
MSKYLRPVHEVRESSVGLWVQCTCELHLRTASVRVGRVPMDDQHADGERSKFDKPAGHCCEDFAHMCDHIPAPFAKLSEINSMWPASKEYCHVRRARTAVPWVGELCSSVTAFRPSPPRHR